MSDLIDRWRKGRAEFYTEDSMYSIGDKMAAELEAVKAREEAYSELVMAVETKHEGETRHQTALRYIREAEHRPSSGPFVTASGPPGATHAPPLLQSREGMNPVERLLADASGPPARVPHVVKEGSREHVTSWDTHGGHCSEPMCEMNRPSEPPGEPSETGGSPVTPGA